MCCFQVKKSSKDFWNDLKLTWRQCSDLPVKCYVSSIAELDGKVYIAVTGRLYPLIYDPLKVEWSSLRKLPRLGFSLVAVHHSKQLLAIGGVLDDVISNKIYAWGITNKDWTTPYPDMPTPRFKSSCISHGSAVIVAGGVTSSSPFTVTGTVEVLHITEHSSWFSKSYSGQWSVVKQLPYVIYEAIPLIVDDHLYIAGGYDDNNKSTCNIVTSSLPELLRSNVKRSNIWHKLPDMPYSPWSITHYQDHVIIFNGDHKRELVKQSYLYNPNTNSWDCVGDDFHGYKLGRSVHLKENKIIFIGGMTGIFMANREFDWLKTCSILTLNPK